MYINSGGIPEYCEGYGIMFNNKILEEKLQHVIDNYIKYQQKMSHYPFKATAMSSEYLKEFNRLKDIEIEITNNRNLKDLQTSSEVLYKIKRKLKKTFSWH